MGTLSEIGKKIVEGAKFVFNHRQEIKEAADAVTDVASVAAAMKKDRQEAKSEKEYYAVIEEENAQLKSSIIEIAQGISDLENFFEAKIQELEHQVGNVSDELTTSKDNFEQRIRALNNRLLQIAELQEGYQKKADFRFFLSSICCGMGIIISIILAVAL